MIRDAGSCIARGACPLFQGGIGLVALFGIFDDRVASETTSAAEAIANRTAGQKQVAESHTKVLSFGDMEEGQHAFATRGREFAGSDQLFPQGKNSRLAGREQDAEIGLATKPPGPGDAPMVETGFEVVLGERFGNEMSQTFHG